MRNPKAPGYVVHHTHSAFRPSRWYEIAGAAAVWALLVALWLAA